MIGRGDAIDVVRERLAVDRLVTLTGPGGVGKTRLAIEAARALTDRFPDGVWLVELAGRPARADPEALGEIAEHVATALGIREDTVAGLPDDRWPDPTDRLVAALHERCTLLVLDNCDHLLTPVAHLAARLLDAAAQVRVLTTSREPLGAAGEVTLPVPPLAVPAADATTEQIAQAAAVRLFVSRAHAAEPGFALGADTAETVATVCRRLDGIPLALELAANRLRALDVAELAARLDDRFRLLSSGKRTAPARQQTLRAMIDYSWEPLTAAERSVLSRLATFADGATLAAAEQVCSGGRVAPGDVLDVLARLVDRSLVTVRDGESPRRYRLLETVAAFGLERLEEAGETDATRRRHAAFFARLAEDTALRLRGHDQHRALAELEAEPANLRAALDDAAARGWSLLCLRLATSLAWYRLVWGRFREAGRDLRTALDTVAACDDDRAPDTLRRHAETWLTAVAPHGSDPAAARRQVLERYGNARDTDVADRAFAQWLFAFTMLHSGDATEAAQLVGAALATFRDVGDRWGVAAALSTRADLALVQGDLVRAQHDSEACRSLFTQLGDRRGQVHPTGVLGAVAEIRGDYATAAARYREALRIAEELKLWASVSKQLACLGRLALLAGDHADAVAYHERALRVAEEQSNRPAAAFAGTGLAMIARRSGDLDAAEARMRDLLDWNHHTGYQPGAAFALAELGFVAEQRGDAATAERRHRASLEAARATGDDRAVALAIEGLAGSAGLTGGHRRAARLLGVAAALREAAGAPLPSDEGHDVHRIAARTREALGDADFVAELRRGGRLDLADPAVLGDGQRDVSAP